MTKTCLYSKTSLAFKSQSSTLTKIILTYLFEVKDFRLQSEYLHTIYMFPIDIVLLPE